MENNDNIIMSRIAFERIQSKDEQNDRWRNIIIIILIILLVATNVMWLWYESQYDYLQTDEFSVDIDAGEGGNANYIGNNGDINNGENNSYQKENTEPDKE